MPRLVALPGIVLVACATSEPPVSSHLQAYPSGQRAHAAGHDDAFPRGHAETRVHEASYLCDATGWSFHVRPTRPVLAGVVGVYDGSVGTRHPLANERGARTVSRPDALYVSELITSALTVDLELDAILDTLTPEAMTPVGCGSLEDRAVVVELEALDDVGTSTCIWFGGIDPSGFAGRDCLDWNDHVTVVVPLGIPSP